MIRMMDSHAYPGCPAVADEPPQEGPVHVEFSDGAVAGGRVERLDDDRITLTIDAYRTGKGTAIVEKSWLLENRGEDRWRVSRRLDREE
ncbi:hypothetical protein KYK30_16780 [Shinella yambaruensis]|nr:MULTISPECIES: hypothetical protein [Shinella]MCJ8027293.1 hypothetical protein [Shinella yambaruensis]MCU7981349.1 hypothetical protein [Shinella yambaruensis]MCW5709316.1 hypothetical protein [Shinella sp.]